MHAGRKYTLKEITLWTRRETFLFLFFAAIPTALYALANCKWLALPWLPIAMVGTAVAFVTGFKNNASYARLWEARQIWGAIVNSSRVWAIFTINSIPDPASRQRLFLRHFAWLTALRYQLREERSWENMNLNYNIEYKTQYDVAEWTEPLEPILAKLLTQENLTQVFAKKNRAFHILDQQSRDLQSLLPAGNDLRQIEMQHLIASLIDAQGKCERIKNFPYPRQFATLNNLFTWLFVVLVPFGLLQEFHKMGEGLV